MTFKEKVYQITSQIPSGKVATYGQIARLADSPHSARAVGMCMRTNPYAPKVPCHRVVASNGQLTGFSGVGGLTTKKQFLISEGVELIRNKVNLSRFLWKPKLTDLHQPKDQRHHDSVPSERS